MSFFESLLALLLAAILLTQVARRLGIPYPSMLAAAGLFVALIPGAPTITLDPSTALALFVAPALLDIAFDFPVATLQRLWRPLVALAVLAVLLTTAAVAGIGMTVAGLPMAAAITLGAIVAPPDAAAATAMLNGASLPRRTVEVLKGESLLNDATALLIFGAAIAIQHNGGVDAGVAAQLTLAAPGGALLGVGLALVYRRLMGFVAGTLGGNLLEFVTTFWIWIIAERLHLSAVLCVVSFAMTVARSAEATEHPRHRVHSFAVWGSAVFLLNVLAFLLMGMQVRTIVGGMTGARLKEAMEFCGFVIATVVATRLLVVLVYNRLAARHAVLRGDFDAATVRQGLLVGWCGMRGLVTLATAFALPASFPQRDLIVLTAFGVVLATVVGQGLTLNPLIRLLRLGSSNERDDELTRARHELAGAALDSLDGKSGKIAEHVRHHFEMERDADHDDSGAAARTLDTWRAMRLKALRAQRARLITLRYSNAVGAENFEVLQEELDWKELALNPATEATIDEA